MNALLADSTAPAPGPVDARRIIAILWDQSQEYEEGGEALTDESFPNWRSRPGSPAPDVSEKATPEAGLTNPQPGSS